MNFDDPRITAYALGELESAEDRAVVEQLLSEHPELLSEIEETRSFADLLRRELTTEETAPLTSSQREEVLMAAIPPHVNGTAHSQTKVCEEKIIVRPWWRRHWVPSAVAATVVLTTSIAGVWKMQQARFTPLPVTVPASSGRSDIPVPRMPTQAPPADVPALQSGAAQGSTVTVERNVTGKVTAPAQTGKESRNEQVTRLYVEGKQFYDTGRYDLAWKRAEQIINLDSYNIAARKLQEEINKKRQEYSASGGNQTRSQTTLHVTASLDRPISKMAQSSRGVPHRGEVTTVGRKVSEPSKPASFAPHGDLETEANVQESTGERFGSLADNSRLTLRQQLPTDSPNSSLSNPPPSLAPAELKAGTAGGYARSAAATKRKEAGLERVIAEGNVVMTDGPKQRGRALHPTGVVAEQSWAPQPGTIRTFNAPGNQAGPSLVKLEPSYKLYKSLDELQVAEQSNTESYDNITDNAFLNVSDNPLSTFSIDVDTASYSNVRRFLSEGQRPPKGAVRIEELVNYFPYSYSQPEGKDPFSCTMEVAPCPWKPEHRLVRIGLKGREIAREKLPPSNLIFLVDVSGSMNEPNKLPLVKASLQELVGELREQDSVGIVVYAGSSGVVLEPTHNKEEIRAAINRLNAGGSTNGAAGIQGAYRLAQKAFKKGGNNRVILATDGDFNVGVTSQSELVDLIQQKAKTGVFLSVLGYGMGNMKDSTMEKLADTGNGNYAYIDSLKEGRKVLVEQMSGTLFTIAKDVKIQVEFNPAQAGAYRLIGYENRVLAKEDFNDDKKDAGEIGAGHTVSALYEVVPASRPSPVTSKVDPLKYQKQPPATEAGAKAESKIEQAKASTELLTLKLRFKQPDGDTSELREYPLTDSGLSIETSSPDFRWAAAVASFGMLLRDSPYRGNATWDSIMNLASEARGMDPAGHRAEFINLIEDAKRLVPVTPLDGQEQPITTSVPSPGKAASIVVPEFNVTEVPILDAMDTLSKKSREHDPEKKGVSLVFAGGNNAAQMKVSLRMQNTSVLETGKALASLLRLQMEEQGDILIFRAEQ